MRNFFERFLDWLAEGCPADLWPMRKRRIRVIVLDDEALSPPEPKP